MSIQFETVRAKNHPQLTEKMQQWVEDTQVAAIEDVTVHRDETGQTVYSIFYWRETPTPESHTSSQRDFKRDKV